MSNLISRRTAIKTFAMGTAIAASSSPFRAAQSSGRKMTVNLMCGMIGVRANQREAIDLAHRHGFESVEPMAGYLADLRKDQLGNLLREMKAKGVVFGAAGLPVDFRQEDSKFQDGIKSLSNIADGLQRAGVTRMGTWLMPGHNQLTHLQNLKQHKRRLGEIAKILGDHGIRFGLEYVGTKTLRDRFHFEFVHTMAETKELLAEIDRPNMGFILDSWHWWNANESAADILTLENKDIIAVDLNDAPSGIPIEQQQDGRRELPLATGVIPVAEFVGALKQLQYDGPVRAEPFNAALNELDNEAACAKTSAALHKALGPRA